MKSLVRPISIAFICFGLWASPLLAQSEPQPAAADKAFNELQAVTASVHPLMNDRARMENMNAAERSALMGGYAEVVIALAEKFLADFPSDPRRGRVIASMLNQQRRFSGEDADARRAAWAKRRVELRDQLLALPDVDAEILGSILEREIYAVTGRRGFSEQPPDLKKATELVELMKNRAASSDRRRFAERSYVELLRRTDPAAAEAHLRSRLAEKEINPNLAAQSEGMLRIMTGFREPLDLKFTAVDGRKVDLADYRGKVVLIDFWATWCVPCMQEMPNVKRVYAKYRDQGFDIIGISLDANPRDPAKPRKHEKTAEQLKEFVGAEGMPWPHHYDGKHWDNEYSRKYALGSIPATFLIGKDGRIYSTENHGEKLEANVKKLLSAQASD
jgi:thiol-disulfide isomerase/thioredoxin